MTNHRADHFAAAVAGLLTNPEVRRRALAPASFWSIVHYGESSYENRYNRVVRWLLDPTENHGLGADIANAVIADATGTAPGIGVRRVRTRVETPVPGATIADGRTLEGRIDVTLVDHDSEIVVALESKLASATHDEQLARYRAHIEAAYPSWRRFFIFLTEDDAPADDDGWAELGYRDLARIVHEVCEGRDLAPEVAHVIADFTADIERRGAGPVDARIAELYGAGVADATSSSAGESGSADHESRGAADAAGVDGYADVIAALARELEPDPAVYASSPVARFHAYLCARGNAKALTSSDAVPRAESALLDRVLTALEAAGFSSSEAIRVLTFVFDHAPRVVSQDHSIQPGIREFFDAYLRLVTGSSAGRGTHAVVPDQSVGGYLRTVRRNRGGKGITFNDDIDGMRPLRVAGNDTESFPWWVAHLGASNSACAIAGRQIAPRPLAQWTVADLHGELDRVLRAAAAGVGACTCGEILAISNV